MQLEQCKTVGEVYEYVINAFLLEEISEVTKALQHTYHLGQDCMRKQVTVAMNELKAKLALMSDEAHQELRSNFPTAQSGVDSKELNPNYTSLLSKSIYIGVCYEAVCDTASAISSMVTTPTTASSKG